MLKELVLVNIEVKGHLIEVKYEKQEGAVIDRECVKQMIKEAVEDIMNKIDISKVAFFEIGKIRAEHPFYSFDYKLETKTGECFSGSYHTNV